MLDKNNREEFDLFYKEFADANLFIFPTRNEYHGIVNCEAAAYGLPIFSHDTCGVNSYVIDGENGRALPLESSPDAFAKAIYESASMGLLEKFSINSRRFYEERFNWTTWGQKSQDVMHAHGMNK